MLLFEAGEHCECEGFVVGVFGDGFLLVGEPGLDGDFGFAGLLLVVFAVLLRDVDVDALAGVFQVGDAQAAGLGCVDWWPWGEIASPRHEFEDLAPVYTCLILVDWLVETHDAGALFGGDVARKDCLEPVEQASGHRTIACSNRQRAASIHHRVVLVQQLLEWFEESPGIVSLGSGYAW